MLKRIFIEVCEHYKSNINSDNHEDNQHGDKNLKHEFQNWLNKTFRTEATWITIQNRFFISLPPSLIPFYLKPSHFNLFFIFFLLSSLYPPFRPSEWCLIITLRRKKSWIWNECWTIAFSYCKKTHTHTNTVFDDHYLLKK